MERVYRSILLIAVLLLAGISILSAPVCTHAQKIPADRLYTNSAYRWKVSYPEGWKVKNEGSTFVKIISPSGTALCGFHSQTNPGRFKTVDEFTEFMLAQTEGFLRQRGFMQRVANGRQISLPNNITGTDVLVDIVPGGRSRRIFVLAKDRILCIDCETYAGDWEKLSETFERIISSFTVQ
jgi:hypothetical protein